MPHDKNSTTHDKKQGREFTGNISRTLSDAMVTSMAEYIAIRQGVMNIPTFNGKNMPVLNSALPPTKLTRGICSFKIRTRV